MNLPPPPPPAKAANPAPPPPAPTRPAPPPPPLYRREPAITLEALQKRANERGFHLYYAAYSVIEPVPWHLGYLFWLHSRTEEAKRAGRTHDMTAFVLDWINTHPSKEAVS